MAVRRTPVVGRYRCEACGAVFYGPAGPDLHCPGCMEYDRIAWEDWEEIVRCNRWEEGVEAKP